MDLTGSFRMGLDNGTVAQAAITRQHKISWQ